MDDALSLLRCHKFLQCCFRFSPRWLVTYVITNSQQDDISLRLNGRRWVHGGGEAVNTNSDRHRKAVARTSLLFNNWRIPHEMYNNAGNASYIYRERALAMKRRSLAGHSIVTPRSFFVYQPRDQGVFPQWIYYSTVETWAKFRICLKIGFNFVWWISVKKTTTTNCCHLAVSFTTTSQRVNVSFCFHAF